MFRIRIRVQKGKIFPTKIENKCKGIFNTVAWASFMDARGKVNLQFLIKKITSCKCPSVLCHQNPPTPSKYLTQGRSGRLSLFFQLQDLHAHLGETKSKSETIKSLIITNNKCRHDNFHTMPLLQRNHALF